MVMKQYKKSGLNIENRFRLLNMTDLTHVLNRIKVIVWRIYAKPIIGV